MRVLDTLVSAHRIAAVIFTMNDNVYETGSYFITSVWGTVFAVGVALVLCYLLFVIIRFLIRRFSERKLRNTLKHNYQQELQRLRSQLDPD